MDDLRSQELMLLSILEEIGAKISIDKLMADSKLSDSAIMRSALLLKEKNLINLLVEQNTIINSCSILD